MIVENDSNVHVHGALSTARLLWQTGDWEALALQEVPSGIETQPNHELEILIYKMQGLFMTGAIEDGRALLQRLQKSGVSQTALSRVLMSGASASLAQAHILANDPDAAERNANVAISLHPEAGDVDLIVRMRMQNDRRALQRKRPLNFSIKPIESTLFIDCGGYDGCSAISFLLTNPHADVVSFEPNPDLWHYYNDIPTKLIRKAAYTYNGHISFTVDPTDGDGSTVMEGKKIDFYDKVRNEDCPVLEVPCVNLSDFVRRSSEKYDRIVLKLDVEGAEYDILEKMLEDNTVDFIESIYCEFHQNKLNIDPERHKFVFEAVSDKLPLSDWDALAFSANIPDSKGMRVQRRSMLVNAIKSNRNKIGYRSCG